MVVLDEAHRMRNVYKTSNVIAKTLKEALAHVHSKILLIATPLQNQEVQAKASGSSLVQARIGLRSSHWHQDMEVSACAARRDYRIKTSE